MLPELGPLDILERIRRPPAPPPTPEHCDLCAREVPSEHSHVIDLEERGLRCACRPCALLFTRPSAGRFRTVPDDYRELAGFELSPGQWDALQIPVAMAFFLRGSRSGEVAGFYPSPAGATECLLPLDAWAEVEWGNPVVREAEPDVEAVLVRAVAAGFEAYIVPIDACYELVGHLRRLWRGFDGGREVHQQVDAFFERIRDRAGRG